MAVKHQIEPIGPVYLGGTEINRIYLGTTLVYSTPPYPYSTTDIIDGLGGWNGNYTDLGNDKASVTLDNGNTITIIPSKTYVIFHDPIVDAYFKERLGVTSGEVTLAQFRTLDASTAAFTSAHRPENYAEVTEFNEYRFLGGTTVYTSGFYGCSALEEIRIPETVTSINSNAFRATSLVSIDIPSTVTSLAYYVFQDCASLTTVTGMEGIRTIGVYAFYNCTSLLPIDFSKFTNLQTIEGSAFRYCTGMNGSTLDFSGCSQLTTIAGGAFRNINFSAFDFTGCTSLRSIGGYAFDGSHATVFDLSSCTSLTNLGYVPRYVTDLRVPSSLVSLGTGTDADAMRGMAASSLRTLDLSHCTNLTTIGTRVFYGWTRDANRPLITIKLPASVTSLLTSCISGMPSATVFIFLSTTPPTSSSAVQSNTNVTYYVPYSADHSILEAYQTATNWSGAAARIFELDENGDIPS